MPMDWGLARDYAARDVHGEETRVTEAEWLAETDPQAMLEFMCGKASERELRLFAVGCCRRVWPGLGKHGRRAVDVAERYADGQADERELKDAEYASRFRPYAGDAAAHAACISRQDLSTSQVALDAYLVLSSQAVRAVESNVRVSILRCVFGNPFRRAGSLEAAWLERSERTVGRLAATLYADRAFDRLPLLADALEDAGCTDAELLGHLRGPGPHVRGCWAVDLVLGKS
jgi:hypothetical protein